ncbi:hypothetical protein FA95DRAFT_1611184 [Auriscalpium vulgare]|uniref:Uncharacterized protein n=1 Tax=Auriscalpium vulgare TaxID=40419 RepID=A0ACB8RB11_9AGAM|nr:hypothetical protein FA95DRAFT_1611184 [Auriscalpium vulgare]
MVNWKDPAVAARTDEAYVKLTHVLLGVTVWEIVTTCDFEIDVLRRKRPYRWPIWIYLCCRLSALACFTVLVIEKDISGLQKCRAWDLAAYVFAYFALGSASLLMLLRITAIWNRNILISAASFVVWLTGVGLNTWYLVIIRAQYVPLAGECIPIDSAKAAPSVIGAVSVDTILFLVMFAGILRHRVHGIGITGLWSVLWRQGLVWLALAIVSELPAMVFILLDLNDAWDVMFQVVTVITMAIGSTRMHRILTDYHPTSKFSPAHAMDPPVMAVHVRRTTTTNGGSNTLPQNIAVELGDAIPMVPVGLEAWKVQQKGW